MRRLCPPAILVLLAVSCHEPTKAAVDRDLDAIAISVDVQPSSIIPGNAANVVLTLTNNSIRSIEVSSCPIYFWVQDMSGNVVGGAKTGMCIAMYVPLRFAPRETTTLTQTWFAQDTQNIPAGAYRVFGWVNDPAHHSLPKSVTVQPASSTSF